MHRQNHTWPASHRQSAGGARHNKARPVHCFTVPPPGEFIGTLLEPLLVDSESFIKIAIIVFAARRYAVVHCNVCQSVWLRVCLVRVFCRNASRYGQTIYVKAIDKVFNPLMGTGNYSAISNNMKLVHWPLMGGLLRLVQR